MKAYVINVLSLFIITSCTLDNHIVEKDIIFLNDYQTNNTTVNIITVEEAKERVIRDIIDSGYALPDSFLLKDERTAYLKDVNWGPVIFVENLKDHNILHKYFYLFYGQMPDGSVAAVEAVDAQTGEVFAGGVMNNYYPDRKMFILSPDEAKDYVAKKYNLNDSDITIKAVFYPDGYTANDSPIEDWKYEVRLINNKLIKTRSLTTDVVYVNPFIAGPKKVEPNETNTAHLLMNKRLTVIGTSLPSGDIMTKGINENAHFIPLE